jgi:hypothetical protein
LEVPVRRSVAVLQRIVALFLVPYLNEDIGQVGDPLDDQEPVVLTAQPVDEFGEFPGACPNVPVTVLCPDGGCEHADHPETGGANR